MKGVIIVFAVLCCSYDSHLDNSRDNKKNKFANTMAFMEEYLNNVLIDDLPFANEEKNKLTYEVQLHIITMNCQDDTSGSLRREKWVELDLIQLHLCEPNEWSLT